MGALYFGLDIEWAFMLYLLLGFIGGLALLPDFDETEGSEDEDDTRFK